MIDFELKSDRLGQITVEDAARHEQFIQQLNYLINEGFIEVKEGEDGTIRLFPAT